MSLRRYWPYSYVLIAVAMGLVYPAAHKIIIDQACSFITIISNVTLNLIILFGMWGLLSDQMTQRFHWSQRTGWIVFFIGLFCAVMFLSKGAGFETRFI